MKRPMCRTCRFYDGPQQECWRFPPQVNYGSGGYIRQDYHPQVLYDSLGCGEWKPREPDPAVKADGYTAAQPEPTEWR